jgi:diguanylate cyclase (GGDEF)-like protein/PAS domain S-box-containing protein
VAFKACSRGDDADFVTGPRVRCFLPCAQDVGPSVAAVEELLSPVVEDVADAVVMIDGDHRIVAFSRAARDMFGYDTVDVIGEPLDVLLPVGLGERHRDRVDQFASGVVSRQAMSDRRTLMGRRRNGDEFSVEITIAKSSFAGGVFFNAVIRDVTSRRRDDERLSASLGRFEALVRQASDGITIADVRGRILYASPAAQGLLGVSECELVGMSGVGLLHPDDNQLVSGLLTEALATPGESVHYEARLRGRDDAWMWAEVTATNLTDDLAIGGFVFNFRDISQRKAAEAQRAAVATLGSRALAGMSLEVLAREAATYVIDLVGADSAAVLERVESQSYELAVRACVGWPEEFVGRRVVATAGSPTARTLSTGRPVIVEDYATEPPFPGKELVDAANIRSTVSVVIPGHGGPWGLLGVMSAEPRSFSSTDADFVQAIANVLASAVERDHTAEELSRQALRDPLTGVANRALLADRVEHALATARRSADASLAVLFVDVDNFTRINDSLGHDVGDRLLCDVARRIQATVREEDTVARFAGDEFVVVTRHRTGSDSPLVLADRVMYALRQPYEVDGHELFVTASIGIAISSDHSDSVDSLLRDADAAMRQAKYHGRDRCMLFDSDVRAELVGRLETERDLRVALARDELVVYYQPVVDATTGNVAGAEALVRWLHPERGFISPAEFIPIAEDAGLIRPIGRWVLRSACMQLARWQAELGRPDLSVSVNLSPRELADPEIVDEVSDAIALSGLAPASLRLEITETSVVDDVVRAAGTLSAIAELGVGLVLDDLGTGYSSLSHLKELPVSCIKIDRSFVSGVCDDPADRAIVAAVTELAHQLGVCAVAEGVETPEQLAMVQSLGCNLIQGYIYAPALPPSDFEAWLRHETAEAENRHVALPPPSTRTHPDRPRPALATANASAPPNDPRSAHQRGTPHTTSITKPEFLSNRAVGRYAAVLWILSGAITLASPLLPAPASMNRASVVTIGMIALGLGAVFLGLPWQRWPRSTSLWIAGVPAQALIGFHNYFGGADPYRYGLFFMVCYAWIGLTQPRWSTLKLAPFSAAAYLVPLLVDHRPAWAVCSIVYALPIFILLGETTAWVCDKLNRSYNAMSLQAFRDTLTGLPNRAELYVRVEKALARARRNGTALAFLFIDLDRFKNINDELGHEIGDAVLREVATRLHGAVRAPDTVARLAGDEFAILAEDIDNPGDVEHLARRIIEAFREPFEIRNTTLDITASVGATIAEADDTDIDSLLRDSDRAMYTAKAAGGNDFHILEIRPARLASNPASPDVTGSLERVDRLAPDAISR